MGEPGSRVFFLQAVEGTQVVSLRLEKQQVGALGQYLQGVLSRPARSSRPTELPVRLDLVEPVVAEWVVGTLGVAYDDASRTGSCSRPTSWSTRTTTRTAAWPGSTSPGPRSWPSASYAEDLVAAGRPPCPICGQPMDPDGHICPRSNGHK